LARKRGRRKVGIAETPASLNDISEFAVAAEEDARRGDIQSLVDRLEKLVGFAGPHPEVLAVLADKRPFIDAAMADTESNLDLAMRASLTERANRLWAFSSKLAKTLIHRQGDDPESLRLLVHPTLSEDIITAWKAAREVRPGELSLGLGLLRAIEAAGRGENLVETLIQIASDATSLEDLSLRNQSSLVEMFRILMRLGAPPDESERLSDLRALMIKRMVPSALLCWVLGVISAVGHDRATALVHFNDGLNMPAPPPEAGLDLRGEKALLFARYHMFGEALDAKAGMSDKLRLPDHAYYRRRLEPVDAVAALCQEAPHPLRYPECLIDVIVKERMRRPVTYRPEAGHVAMVSSSLGPGGAERQSVAVTERLARDTRVKRLSFFVRSAGMRTADDAFFLPTLRRLPVEVTIYGERYHRADVAHRLPELKDRPRLLSAIDLLPHTMREDVVRVCRLLYDKRPQAVHIWQDMPGPALACFIVGVPRCIVRRGSLSPDRWEHNEHQLEVFVRPMRHVYRRLLESTGLVILNNSSEGSRTDQVWTAWHDSSRFGVLHNVVDFESLGPSRDRNVALRRRLGIPSDAPVIGGIFRFVEVKRPEFWIEAASQIAEQIPSAHFIIVGDGPLLDATRLAAARSGLSGRLHLPGRISNVGDLYRAMDVLLLTSKREGTPNTVIEAQHFGVPIVATDVGGIAQAIVPGRSGYVLPGRTPAEYAGTVIAILGDPAWRERAAGLGKTFAHERFGVDAVLDQLVEYYGIAGE